MTGRPSNHPGTTRAAQRAVLCHCMQLKNERSAWRVYFGVFVGGVQKLRWLENFEWGNEIPRRTANSSSASASVTREEVIAECPKAARDGFEAAMKDYAMIGPSGMARTMLNYIGALASRPATAGTLEEKAKDALFEAVVDALKPERDR